MSARHAPVESIDVGDIRVTYLPDGDASLSASAIFPAANDALWEAHRELFDDDGKLLMSLGGFLVESGGKKIIVDLGFGDMTVPFPPVDGEFRGGKLLTSLRQAGVEPGDVDVVFYTHMHLDHVGWTAQNGELTFPNARHVVGDGEFDFWQGVTDEGLAAVGPHPEAVQAPLVNRIESVADGALIATGVNVLASPGHTPGHCSAVISSGQERAIILGDVVHCPLQLADGDLRIIFDVDPDVAARTRDRIAAELEGDPTTIGADGHFSGSAFGRIVPASGRRWVDLAETSAR
ncbi:MBL fold metallo-hydrolase [Pseudonocardia sp. KRD-184]|uniref:MBL fold metallo-hydrolase n=1 Tax=Pseudonocardia oceani TaxID=2792013 RepID=A0ABS6UEG7_9PSEU|nr:MBL fold metallo-hydrolase [Pseudonocardia oceani]MBW0088018.1 MBL fold metallo-hydrolase [Pseudonocardia oceani]MBW0094487.1 MBL fold metallo-hydrolase [Pseudonocardia oceani]MBW0107489.1 MBL fold metallo-hydrolase [Pseudonocardia oceani]MBW0120448.1 MBL fold metallo-hydrolase [Pseudonocardia oceani]MBW0130594.1 MBL fold metallo-hydrolase [Pseudonocardia oceani]